MMYSPVYWANGDFEDPWQPVWANKYHLEKANNKFKTIQTTKHAHHSVILAVISQNTATDWTVSNEYDDINDIKVVMLGR
jgi:hypothetical protein